MLMVILMHQMMNLNREMVVPWEIVVTMLVLLAVTTYVAITQTISVINKRPISSILKGLK